MFIKLTGYLELTTLRPKQTDMRIRAEDVWAYRRMMSGSGAFVTEVTLIVPGTQELTRFKVWEEPAEIDTALRSVGIPISLENSRSGGPSFSPGQLPDAP
jgi:hypothetical protein